jgi:hypothetical protein
MKLLEREETVVPKTRTVVAPRPVAKPEIKVRARVVTRPATRRKSNVAARAATFVAILGLTYASSTLAGHVVLEGARQKTRHGADRAAYARQEAKKAREAIEALTNPTVLRVWADAHGFVAGEAPKSELPHGGTLVARR